MNMSEIWGFKGILIATSAATALTLIKSVGQCKKYFYEIKNDFFDNLECFPVLGNSIAASYRIGKGVCREHLVENWTGRPFLWAPHIKT